MNHLLRLSALTIICLTHFLLSASLDAQTPPLQIEIDARDIARKLLSAKLTIPITKSEQPQEVVLWYPKWLPGTHGPGGPIANVAGLTISDPAGTEIPWKRSPGEVYRLVTSVPPNTSELIIQIRYITDQPTTNSMGHDSFSSSRVAVISPGNLLFVREGNNIDETNISLQLRLPKKWQAATAIKRKTQSAETIVGYEPTSLRNFVDSPIMCGEHYRTFELTTTEPGLVVAPHVLHLFSEKPAALDLDSKIIDSLKRMVTQTAKLTGSQPFDRFDILLAITDLLPANGLEHSRSTLNVLPISSLSSLDTLKGWNRLLIPHEYLHAWCGKFRQPAEMVTSDFQSPQGTDLLWVYEGLTQYLGELVEARCGLMSKDEFRDRLSVELRNAYHQQNRQWRPLLDTAAASHILRDRSPNWSKLRGSQDYYMEGMLFWIEADAIIRTHTANAKSLDDFCHLFFASPQPTATYQTSKPSPYTRQDIIALLNSLTPYDWDGLIRRRIETVRTGYDLQIVDLLGYEFKPLADRPRIPTNTFRYFSGIDHLDTVGFTLSSDGTVTDIKLGSPADTANIAPGMKIIGIDNYKWNRERLDAAIAETEFIPTINLIVEDGEAIKSLQLQYSQGARYLQLRRNKDKSDLLESILNPR